MMQTDQPDYVLLPIRFGDHEAIDIFENGLSFLSSPTGWPARLPRLSEAICVPLCDRNGFASVVEENISAFHQVIRTFVPISAFPWIDRTCANCG